MNLAEGMANAGYAVGTEFSRRSRRVWLRCAGGSAFVALLGKLLPLFAVFYRA